MKKFFILTSIVLAIIIIFFVSVILKNGLTPPKSLIINGKTSLVLTHTTLAQLSRPGEAIELIFDETVSNPYIYGWDGDDLYYKDALNRDFVLLAGKTKAKRIKIDNPQFLKQEKQSGICDPNNKPNYKTTNYPGDLNRACYTIEQAGIKIESWIYEIKDLLTTSMGYLVIIKDGKKYIFNEPRTLSDLVISASGKYLALTISDPVSYPGFDATNVQVIELP